MLVERADAGAWAWVGLRLAPGGARPGAAPSDAPVDQHHLAARSADHAWLAAQCVAGRASRFELRYLNDPRSKLLRAVLLGQVYRPPGGGDQEVVADARALRDRLAEVPGHLRSAPLTSAEVRRELRPFAPDLGSVYEVRKRLSWSPCTRRDTGRQVCFVVVPFDAGGLAWDSVWAELAELPARALVSVCLEPYQVSPGLRMRLGRLAEEYARLATPGTTVPTWSVPAAADPFAAAVAPLYLEAAHRYVAHAYRVRISVASEAPLPPRFAESVAAAVSPGGPAGAGLPGGGTAALTRPVGHEAELAWQHVAVTGQGWLDEAYRQGTPPGQLREEERILCDLVDVRESAAAFRLPYQVPWRRPLFDSGDPPASPAPTAPRRQPLPVRYDVFVSYSHVDAEWVHTVLVPRLRGAGLRVVLDSDDFRIGAPTLTEIERAVEVSRRTLLVLTPAYLTSEWAEFENLLTQTADPANRRRRLIPVLLEPVALPARVAMLSHLDLTRPRGVEDGLRRLVGQLLAERATV
ncbi:toll/interleukin-1 receptor domain-containing protein [Frankia sp. AgB32]|uniref:toll/interleukin-1 receptor domain-containing protein n=1 Tax=Frankia sp. AgB32 TaxID=631119 RepID=UPI00200F0283|nr:toll/interleukin-1 receptor domain-containing protein [Frankia sp. AgB32]MCK9897259.1 toll/interleukin-1 receptor domain-containing protein [Frankia sp. AgB32]